LRTWAGAASDHWLCGRSAQPPRLLLSTQVCFEVVGYLLEELRDAGNYEAFKRDVEASNIFIGSLIFIEELAEKVRVW
jgi:hypothetical protein